MAENPLDLDFVLNRDVSDEYHVLFLEYVPRAYLGMCLGQEEVLENVLKKLNATEILADSKHAKMIRFYYALLAWEIHFHLSFHDAENYPLRALKDEMAGNTFFGEALTARRLSDIDYLRYAALKARVEAEYALRNNELLAYYQALNKFELVEANISKIDSRRQAYFSVMDKPSFHVVRFTRASNLLFWMDAVHQQIERRPDWLQDITEQLAEYENRMRRMPGATNSGYCRIPTGAEIDDLVKNEADKLMCTSLAQISYTSLKQKVNKFSDLSETLSKELLFEDSPMFWARHQYLRYQFYLHQVQTHRDQWHPKRTVEFCYTRLALQNTLRIVPKARHDPAVLNWC